MGDAAEYGIGGIMTTAKLLAKIEAEGLEWVLDRYESEPTDDDDLAFEFDQLYRAREKYKELAARFDAAIRKRVQV